MEWRGEGGEEVDGEGGEGIEMAVGPDGTLNERFCAQQVQIPPKLPSILKAYTKAAIRTQPRDLFTWTSAYFHAMANGEVPPVKERIEYPTIEAPSGLTLGLLRVLHKQMKDRTLMPTKDIADKWQGLCLERKYLEELLLMGNFQGKSEVEWPKILVLASSTLGKTLTDTMKILCEAVTKEPDGAEPYISFEFWWELYVFMARNDGGIPREKVEIVYDYLNRIVRQNQNMIGPRDFLHQDCPALY